MSKVLVVLEITDGEVKNPSLGGISCGQQIAQQSGGELHLLLLGREPQAVAQTIAQAGYGAKAVHVAAHAELEPFTAEAWADAIISAAQAIGATAIGGIASSTLRDVIPRVAARLDVPLAAEITGVAGGNHFRREIAAGRALLEFKVNGTFCFTARGSNFDPAQPTGGPAAVQPVALGEVSRRGAEVVGIEKTQSARPALTEADVVVSGGRGMQKGENFKVLEELTDLLGGALGASRAATDAGMVPADLQVGQTGKIVAPNLYIAVGISGAIQHLAGMKGSKTIVAINKNPDEPIFSVADYGLVEKWEEAVPKMIELIKARRK